MEPSLLLKSTQTERKGRKRLKEKTIPVQRKAQYSGVYLKDNNVHAITGLYLSRIFVPISDSKS